MFALVHQDTLLGRIKIALISTNAVFITYVDQTVNAKIPSVLFDVTAKVVLKMLVVLLAVIVK